jgi:hypothetical protein
MPKPMKPLLKVGCVAVGYIATFLLASAVVAVRIANTNGPDAQASSGMYAFGDSILFTTVFGVSSLIPTGVALYFLRPYRRFWIVVSTLGVLLSATGAIAAGLYLVGRHSAPSLLATLAGFSVLRILLAPIFALTFLVCAVISPYRSARIVFFVATAMETLTSACGGLAWFVPLFFRGA